MSQLKSIKCTKCAAPLNLLGGGRVKTITCSYCKSIIDIDNDYQVLGNFKNIQLKHDIPFKIGMQGTVKNIHYTIIGRIRYSELHEDTFWDDLLLFSPLYGYAWLTYEAGHTSYSKRTRNFPNYTWDEIKNIDTLKHKNQTYTADEVYTSRIDYIEGELTWVAKKYDKNYILELYAPPYGISIEKANNELEYYDLEYLDNKEIYDAFNVPKEEQVKHNNIHALKVFGQSFFKPLALLSIWTLAIVVLLTLFVTYDGSGKTILNTSVNNTQVVQQTFQTSTEKYLNTLTLKSSSSASLNNYNIQIKQQDKVIVSINKNSTYIAPSIRSQEDIALDHWQALAKHVKVYFNLKKVMPYVLLVTPIDNNISSNMNIIIKEAESRINYFIFYSLGLMSLLIIYLLKKRLYHKSINAPEETSLLATFYPFIFVYIVVLLFFEPFTTTSNGLPTFMKFFLALFVSLFVYNFIKIPINILYTIYKKIKGD